MVDTSTKKPDDFVIATGKQYSVKYFVNLVCKKLKIQIDWKEKALKRWELIKKQKNNY